MLSGSDGVLVVDNQEGLAGADASAPVRISKQEAPLGPMH
ncbi:hypothetical protein Dfer_0771 [Dyadobacter fermentans DSM 18053]|uniref:Uncharacterized protein n=1 Tax=Dyadobacter fermentans (strain ATCC 700827 / DSM 18053 / CIP 107007 / KCTC 52180 / NS114) TaxID=471854 RepID=C6W258_DYAFD|nr:hypothetical protein Dfer_0771 [Dyadobacter fermentans DSM 18053]